MFLYESCDALNPPFQLPILNSNLRRTLISTEEPSSGLVKVLFYNLKEYLLCVPKSTINVTVDTKTQHCYELRGIDHTCGLKIHQSCFFI